MIMNNHHEAWFSDIVDKQVIANAAPVQDDLVIAAVVDDTDDREY